MNRFFIGSVKAALGRECVKRRRTADTTSDFMGDVKTRFTSGYGSGKWSSGAMVVFEVNVVRIV